MVQEIRQEWTILSLKRARGHHFHPAYIHNPVDSVEYPQGTEHEATCNIASTLVVYVVCHWTLEETVQYQIGDVFRDKQCAEVHRMYLLYAL